MADNLVSEEEIKTRDPEQVAGPGAHTERGADIRPLLEKASEYEYVEIQNPLSVEFIGMFGVSRPIQAPVTISSSPDRGTTFTEADVRNNYGLNLRNADHQGRANIVNRVSIKSGATVRLLGNEAQVVIKQLVNEIMQREGKQLLLADAFARNEVERRIIISRGSVADILGRSPMSIQEQLQQVKEEPHEQAFPDLASSDNTGVTGTGDKEPEPDARPLEVVEPSPKGRPKTNPSAS